VRPVADRIRILVDVHEQRSGIPGLLEELGAEVELLSLPAGDYALGDDTLVERKAVLDLPLVPRATVPPESVAESMLAAIPVISTVTARALLERFGLPAAIAAAPAEAWLEVPGIGMERARALAEALGRGDERPRP